MGDLDYEAGFRFGLKSAGRARELAVVPADPLYEPPIGRPKRVAKPRTTTAIRFTPDTHDRLAVAADERDLSINYLVERACRDYLDRLIPVDEMKWTR